ncbi:Ff.00g064510.m01.CDS01 [Fusarium sp. VM40]|nr:Ff.00g064510.m01.CDS01 [Fusarium sp. VM40]
MTDTVFRNFVAVLLAAEVNGAAEANVAAEHEIAAHPNRRYEVHSIVSYRLDHETFGVDFGILWANEQIITEDKAFWQPCIPPMIFKYWDGLGGRREATVFELFYPSKFHKHRYVNEKCEYLVQWVGYRENGCIWEPAEKIADIASEVKDKYNRIKRLKY